MPRMTQQHRKARELLDRLSDTVEKAISNPNDPAYGLHVMIEWDDRPEEFYVIHIRCRKKNVEKRVQTKQAVA